MKTLILVRHAKSSWDNFELPDFERTLNERGKRDAPQMAKRLHDKKIAIDLFVSSPAKRAKKTAKIFMQEFGIKEENLLLSSELYEATADNYYNVIKRLDDGNTTIALFAHNPGITDFINSFKCFFLNDMPTCGIFAVNINAKKWSDFKESKKEFLFFDYPKNG